MAQNITHQYSKKVLDKINPQKNSEALPLTKSETLLSIVCCIVIVLLAIVTVHSSNSLIIAQRNLENYQRKVNNLHNANASIIENVSNLSSKQHLDKVAQKDGLKLSNKNIRNIN